jgi:hypothetical protein
MTITTMAIKLQLSNLSLSIYKVWQSNIFGLSGLPRFSILMDDSSLSEEVELFVIGQGDHLLAERQNPSPRYVFIWDEKEKKLVN